MKLFIISPFEKKIFDIAWVELNTQIGNFIIQPGHAPMVLTLTKGRDITFCLTNGKQESFVIMQGIADITRTQTTIIISHNL